MPKYYFDVRNVPPETEPVEEDCPNDEVAWSQATRLAGEIFKDVDGRIRPGQEWALDVFDENEAPLYHIAISTKKTG